MNRDPITYSSCALLALLAILGGTSALAQNRASRAATGEWRQTASATPGESRSSAGVDGIRRDQLVWPANQPPNPATVRWDGRDLEIEASNSSLAQILHQVATDTGARLEGPIPDQRVFGNYGPGPQSDVLSKLLEGSGYNVLMYAGHDTGAPLEIVLTARSADSRQMAMNSQNRSYSEPSRQLEPERRPNDPAGAPGPQANQDPYNIDGPPRDPAESMKEILGRQNVIDQQQQDQQKNRQ